MAAGPIAERNQGKQSLHIYIYLLNSTLSHTSKIDATIYAGGLDDKVSETLLWELFVQAGPVGKLN